MSLDPTQSADFDNSVKLALYGITAESGRIPGIDAVVARVAAIPAAVKEAYLRLRARRLLWLEADGVTVRMAPPFSGVPSQHRVVVDGIEYYANCAWDALGIPAALHRPGLFGLGASRAWPHSTCTSDWKDRNRHAGFSIVLCLPPSGGMIWSLPEATCSSSGRRNSLMNGVVAGKWLRDRLFAWTSCGSSLSLGTAHAWRRSPVARCRTKCGMSSKESVWQATFGIPPRTCSGERKQGAGRAE